MTMINAIANAHICLSNEFISSAFLFIAQFSSESIKDLERSRNGWQVIRDHNFSKLLTMTKLVAAGVLLEGPELVHELSNAIRRWRGKDVADHPPSWITFIGIVGWILVSIGVAGEFWVDNKVNFDDGNIQSINIQLLRDANSSALAASGAAGEAEDSATKATSSASDALTLAQGARHEADSFEGDIRTAKAQATDADSKLAVALQEVAADQAEINRLKTPWSLTDSARLVDSLKSFKGTEYALTGVFQDPGSIDLIVAIDKALTSAKWKRVNPPIAPGGISILINGLNIPVTTRSGIWVEAESTEKAEELNARPAFVFPQYIRAGAALKGELFSSISPQQQSLTGPLGIDPGTSRLVTILVGKKP